MEAARRDGSSGRGNTGHLNIGAVQEMLNEGSTLHNTIELPSVYTKLHPTTGPNDFA